jgi:hypothetical protein
MAAGDVSIHGDSGRSIRGIRIVTGTVVLDGGNPTPIDLSAYGVQCLGGVVSIQGSAALADDPNAVTCLASGATLNVYAWKNTSGTDPTQVASTDNARVVDFVATMRAV